MGQEELALRPGYAVKRLQHAVRVATDSALRPTELSMAQFAVLRVLANSPPLKAAQLARRCFITRQSMRDVLPGLRTRKLVTETPGLSGDWRARPLTLTTDGRRLLDRAVVIVNGVDRRMMSGLSEREQEQLVSWLNMCSDNLAEPR